MSHTPGPWAVEQPSGNEGEAEVIASANRTICWTADTYSEDSGEGEITDEDRANALLISAAPDLLSACEELLIYLGDWNDLDNETCAAARAAIAKAKGESR